MIGFCDSEAFYTTREFTPFERRTSLPEEEVHLSVACISTSHSSPGKTCHVTHLFRYFSLFCNRSAPRKFFLSIKLLVLLILLIKLTHIAVRLLFLKWWIAIVKIKD